MQPANRLNCIQNDRGLLAPRAQASNVSQRSPIDCLQIDAVDHTNYLHSMSMTGMIALAIGSAIGTTIAVRRNPELFDPDQRQGQAGADTSTHRLRLGRERPRDRDLIDRR